MAVADLITLNKNCIFITNVFYSCVWNIPNFLFLNIMNTDFWSITFIYHSSDTGTLLFLPLNKVTISHKMLYKFPLRASAVVLMKPWIMFRDVIKVKIRITRLSSFYNLKCIAALKWSHGSLHYICACKTLVTSVI